MRTNEGFGEERLTEADRIDWNKIKSTLGHIPLVGKLFGEDRITTEEIRDALRKFRTFEEDRRFDSKTLDCRRICNDPRFNGRQRMN